MSSADMDGQALEVNDPPLIEEFAYVAIERACGCWVGFVLDDDEFRDEIAADLANWARLGLRIERVCAEEARVGTARRADEPICKHNSDWSAELPATKHPKGMRLFRAVLTIGVFMAARNFEDADDIACRFAADFTYEESAEVMTEPDLALVERLEEVPENLRDAIASARRGDPDETCEEILKQYEVTA